MKKKRFYFAINHLHFFSLVVVVDSIELRDVFIGTWNKTRKDNDEVCFCLTDFGREGLPEPTALLRHARSSIPL